MNRLVLPHPVSANRYWRHFRGMTVRSREAIAYRAEVQAQAVGAGIGQPLTGHVHVEMAYHPRRPKKYTPGQPVRSLDLDNTLKVLIDALNGIAWLDDKQITHLSIGRAEPVPDGAMVVYWRAADGPSRF